MHNPLESHYVSKKILRCAKDTIDFGITFRPEDLDLRAFTNANCVGDPNDRRSTTRFVIYLATILFLSVQKSDTMFLGPLLRQST